MSEFILSCCSTADMPLEFFQTRNVQLICFHFTMDGTEYADDLGQSIPFVCVITTVFQIIRFVKPISCFRWLSLNGSYRKRLLKCA